MPSNFDPFTQNLTFLAATGTPFEVTVTALDEFLQYDVRICINYGAQLGASIVLFVILLLLTRPEKRRSSVFLLNCFALLSNVGRLVCQAVYFTTPFVQIYAIFAGDFSRVPASAYANSIIAEVFITILMLCLEASLVLQVQVICANLRRRYRHALLAVSAAVALIPIGFRMALMVKNCQTIMAAMPSGSLSSLQSDENIAITISICFFCAIFVGKLGYAIQQRRRLGVREFGPMKVIFVMGCQTLVVPAFFSILHYIVEVPQLASNVLTLVTISLPLSSIWAGVTLDNPSHSGSGSSPRRNLCNLLSFSNFLDTRQTASSSMTASLKPGTTCYTDQTSSKQPQRDIQEFGISVEHDISVQSFTREKDIV
ncbi:hypothetical protein BO71DRAFT_322127 [Aspergillus ellipticus CBS 707.79]|uniref:Mating-type alpha-pheromone receptor PreB n=1 Tax=Aspergillus ellipticus CBS 707.79 TaxID=1448320 RepID=A0A319DEU8_9EURO|nr:hypothetical protein BO71DRAFT_322127 [Aspergillus ellipticus CBS 707.79]